MTEVRLLAFRHNCGTTKINSVSVLITNNTDSFKLSRNREQRRHGEKLMKYSALPVRLQS